MPHFTAKTIPDVRFPSANEAGRIDLGNRVHRHVEKSNRRLTPRNQGVLHTETIPEVISQKSPWTYTPQARRTPDKRLSETGGVKRVPASAPRRG